MEMVTGTLTLKTGPKFEVELEDSGRKRKPVHGKRNSEGNVREISLISVCGGLSGTSAQASV